MKPVRPLTTETGSSALRAGELVTRVLAGDREAFGPLVEAYEPSIYGLCRRLCGGDASEAEDLSQETFLQAYRYLHTLADRERFAPWLYQIARSLCRSRRRRRAVENRALGERAHLLRQQAGSGRNGGFMASGNGADGATGYVGAALEELPPPEREVIQLRYFEGLTYDEIGPRLGLTFPQVDHLIRRARARLARRIEARRHREGIL